MVEFVVVAAMVANPRRLRYYIEETTLGCSCSDMMMIAQAEFRHKTSKFRFGVAPRPPHPKRAGKSAKQYPSVGYLRTCQTSR